MTPLPEEFLVSIEQTLAKAGQSDSFGRFLEGFDQPWQRAYRIQTDKIHPAKLAKWLQAELGEGNYLRPVPWSEDGYYLPTDARPGLSTAYQLGLLYIQEASAMLPAEVLAAKPGEKVLDLCAAPGGKSSQTAAKLKGQGLLVANDISEGRARVLQRNLEQQGLRNCVVTHADPANDFNPSWNAYFDAIQLDAPCSGEGMFRRDPTAVDSWQKYGPKSIRPVQDSLLDRAADLLRPGGRLIYSTCTFNTYENEEAISDFLERRPDFVVEDPRSLLPASDGLSAGIVSGTIDESLAKAVRIWPQDGYGEGHFCVLLRKKGSDLVDRSAEQVNNTKAVHEVVDSIQAFTKEVLTVDPLADRQLRLVKNWVYALPDLPLPEFGGIHVLKSGTFLGELKQTKQGKILIPSHSFLLEMDFEAVQAKLVLNAKDERIATFFGGQTILLTDAEKESLPQKGYIAIFVDRYPLCWAKRSGSTLKNLFPAGWVRS